MSPTQGKSNLVVPFANASGSFGYGYGDVGGGGLRRVGERDFFFLEDVDRLHTEVGGGGLRADDGGGGRQGFVVLDCGDGGRRGFVVLDGGGRRGVVVLEDDDGGVVERLGCVVIEGGDGVFRGDDV